MRRLSGILTLSAVIAALTGIAWYAVAASCTSGLPADDAVKGWIVWKGTTKSGEMGSKASYDCYNGAVDAMKDKGIRQFAQQMYKQADGSKYATVDVFRFSSMRRAERYYADKQAKDYKNASPLVTHKKIKDKAFVGTLKTFTFGCCRRGRFVAEVTMTKASSSQDRATVKTFLARISKKLVPPRR